jgi:hypothetical protein
VKIIRNCTLQFKCPLNWEELTPTPHTNMRECSQCQRNVFLVETEAEFKIHQDRGDCIAQLVVTDSRNEYYVGRPERPDYGSSKD